MAISIGRLGSLGLGIENTPGSAASASVYLPYTDISLRGHHEPMEVTSSKASRLMDTSSVVGKKWSEGDVTINLDVINSGYLFKLALGNELYEAGTPSNHTFYTSVSGNTPKTATLIYTRADTDIEQYTYSTVNELSVEVPAGELATVKASFMGSFPTVPASQTPTTTSGTVITFTSANGYFGSSLTTAEGAAATPLNSWTMNLANNAELIYQTGSANITAVRTKGFRASGTYVLYFNATTDRDAHYALNKRSMEIQMTGNANEQFRVRIPQFRLQENEISTGLDDFYVVTADWVAEDVVDSGARVIDVRLQNNKTALYT